MEIKITSGYRSDKASPASSKTVSRQKSQEGKHTARLDTYERSADRLPANHMTSASKETLSLTGDISFGQTLPATDPEALKKDRIDWDSIERYYAIGVTLDNADTLERSADHIASLYVAAKHTIQQKYAGQEDKLTENMNRLDSLLSRAKRKMADSYKNTVGAFFDRTEGSGLGKALGDSLPAAIDKKIEGMEAYAQENGLFDGEKDYAMMELILQTHALIAREKGESLGRDAQEAASGEKSEGYTIKELQSAGFVAKTALKMNPQELLLMNDQEVGIHLAVRYMKMSQTLNHFGMSEEMSSLLLGSFQTWLNQYSGGTLTDPQRSLAPFEYAIKQYQSSASISQALEKSAGKYLGNAFFSTFHNFGGEIRMSLSTRYNLELSQFASALEDNSLYDLMQSISGTGTHTTLYYA